MADTFDRRLLWRTTLIVGSVLAIVISLWYLTLFRGYSLEEQSKSVGTAKDLLEVAAVMIGALWTIRTYLVARTERVAVSVEQNLTQLRLPDGRWLIRVFVTIRNIGKVQVELKSWRLRADQLLPLLPPVSALLASRSAFSEREAKWVAITSSEQGTFAEDSFLVTVEPGESELQIGNLVVPQTAEVIQVYSLFQRSGSGPIAGWSQRSVLDLRKGVANG